MDFTDEFDELNSYRVSKSQGQGRNTFINSSHSNSKQSSPGLQRVLKEIKEQQPCFRTQGEKLQTCSNFSQLLGMENKRKFKSTIEVVFDKIENPFSGVEVSNALHNLKNISLRKALVDKVLQQREINLQQDLEDKIKSMRPLLTRIKHKFQKCLNIQNQDESFFNRYALSPGFTKQKNIISAQKISFNQLLTSSLNEQQHKQGPSSSVYSNDTQKLIDTSQDMDIQSLQVKLNNKTNSQQSLVHKKLFYLNSDIEMVFRSKKLPDKQINKRLSGMTNASLRTSPSKPNQTNPNESNVTQKNQRHLRRSNIKIRNQADQKIPPMTPEVQDICQKLQNEVRSLISKKLHSISVWQPDQQQSTKSLVCKTSSSFNAPRLMIHQERNLRTQLYVKREFKSKQ